MSVISFIASVIDSLAWPVAVIILMLYLRLPLGKLLPELRRLRYGNFEMDFGQQVRSLEVSARTAGLRLPERPAPSKLRALDSNEIISDATRLAVDFPEASVVMAWKAVEHEIIHALRRFDIAEDKQWYGPPVKNVAILHKRGYIEDDTYELLERMRKLRNMAVHAEREAVNITSDEALEFITLSVALNEKLKDLKG